jgi:hypothetical protein
MPVHVRVRGGTRSHPQCDVSFDVRARVSDHEEETMSGHDEPQLTHGDGGWAIIDDARQIAVLGNTVGQVLASYAEAIELLHGIEPASPLTPTSDIE